MLTYVIRHIKFHLTYSRLQFIESCSSVSCKINSNLIWCSWVETQQGSRRSSVPCLMHINLMWLHHYHSSSSLCARRHFSNYYIYTVAYNLAITHATATCCEVFLNSKVFAHLLVEFWCLFVLRLSDRLRQCLKLHHFNCLLASQHGMKPKMFYTSLESGAPSLKISSITANICIQVSFGPESRLFQYGHLSLTNGREKL